MAVRRTLMIALLSTVVVGTRPARADKIADLSHALTSDPDFKVRLTAAMVLGKMRDRRAEPALMQGLRDRNETVRGMSASALGRIGDPQARPALEHAQGDRSPFVRTSAREALAMLRGETTLASAVETAPRRTVPARGARVAIVLGPVHNKTRYGNPRLVGRVRETLVSEVSSVPSCVLSENPPTGYVIEGTIEKITRRANGGMIDVDAEVSFLILKLPGRGIIGTTSGGATVQTPRLAYPGHEEQVFSDAVENAVRGAHPSLVELLKRVPR